MHAHKSGESGFCTSLFSNHLVCASVSIFFILSGMFLFKKDLMNPKVYIEICRKRLRSLVIPFLFWNFIILSVAIVFLFVFPSFSDNGPYSVDIKSFGSILSALIGIGREPIHYQFWFVRNLILFVMISPILKWSLDKGVVSVIIFISLTFLQPYNYTSGICWFYLGAVLSRHNVVKVLTTNNAVLICCSTVLIAIGAASGLGLSPVLDQLNSGLFFISISTLCCKHEFLVKWIFPYTFMVYALHEPFMSLTNKIFTRTIHSDGLGMLFYFVSPIFSILLCILIGICWKRLHPFSYHFSTGGR